MARLKAANNARTTLAQTIDATVTSFTVADASIFPDPPFRITIDDEIMEVGAKDNATNTFSNVIRGVENTISASHDSGAVVENRFTAGTLVELIDANEAQAKVDTHAILNQTHGIGTGYYIAKTSRTDQLPAWIDIPDKPTAFNPIAHKTTHAIGGADALTPADIGAVKNTAGVPELLADVLANRPTAGVVGRLFFATDTGEIYRDNGTTWDLAAASRDGLAAHLADNVAHNISSHFDPTTGHKHTGVAGDGPKLTHDAIDTAKISAFRAYQSTAQSLAAGTWTKLTFQTEEYDQKGEYDLTTYRFMAAAAGIYLFTVGVGWGQLSSGVNYGLKLVKNGVDAIHLLSTSTSATEYPYKTQSALLKLNAGDYVEVYIFSSVASTTMAEITKTFFAGVRLA